MDGFNFNSVIEPLGITALTLLLVTAATGLFRRKLKRRFLTIHKILAILTVTAALCHAVLVIVLLD
jgi:DMSO/TMAO reductase YedYZ heme-binding membrane subunit